MVLDRMLLQSRHDWVFDEPRGCSPNGFMKKYMGNVELQHNLTLENHAYVLEGPYFTFLQSQGDGGTEIPTGDAFFCSLAHSASPASPLLFLA